MCFPPADGHAAFCQSDDELFQCVSVKSSSCTQTRIPFLPPPFPPKQTITPVPRMHASELFIGYGAFAKTSRDTSGNPRLRRLKTILRRVSGKCKCIYEYVCVCVLEKEINITYLCLTQLGRKFLGSTMNDGS